MWEKCLDCHFEPGAEPVLYASQSEINTAAVFLFLLLMAAVVYLLRETGLETREKIAVAVLMSVLVFSGSVLFTNAVLTPSDTPSYNDTSHTPSYDNTTMKLGPQEPSCPSMEPPRISFEEDKFGFENGTLGNYTEDEVREAVLSELNTEDVDFGDEGEQPNNFEKVEERFRQIDSFRFRLRDSLEELESNETNRTEVDTFLDLNESELRRLGDAFGDAVVVEEPEDHYGQTLVDVEELPSSTKINETLGVLEEEYGIGNPTVSDRKPRRIKFANENIDVEERYSPDRYYVVRGSTGVSGYENTHLIIMRGRETLLVRFLIGDC